MKYELELLKKKINVPSAEHIHSELCRRSFYHFVQHFWDIIIPEDPVWNWHIEYLCNVLQEVVERIARREPKKEDIIINIPPGTTKSTICTVMLPAWCWVIDGRIRALTASYSSSLSTDHSVKSRDIIRSDRFKTLFSDIEIKQDQDNKTHYKNNKGGERYATSVGGSITGFHAHILIVDDPLNPKEAASEADRKTANDFMDVTLSTRKVDKNITPTILIMQRLHENDCTGNWLNKRDNIKHICLPGELSKNVKPEYLKDYYFKGLLDANRLDRDALKELKDNLGSYGYAGQIMQTPAPEEGGIWKKWIKPIKTQDIPKNLQKIGTDWDLAYTKDEKNSASAFVTAGLNGLDMYITDLGYDYLEFPELIKFMKQQIEPHYIEAKAAGKSAKQTLKQSGITAVEVAVEGGDKIGRTNLATPKAEAGFIYCDSKLLNTLYNDAKQGILSFPNTGTDLNDALVQAINRLLKRKAAAKIRRGSLI